MCFSPEADFVAAAVIAPVGVETLRRVRHRDAIIVGSLPILFALHQFVEGFVWLGLRGEVSAGLQETATRVYLIYAQGLLPIIVPLGFTLLEPDRTRRRLKWPFVAVGFAVGGYLLWASTTQAVSVRIDGHALSYTTAAPIGVVLAIGYVAATCGPALLSTRRYLRWFGVVNLVGLLAVAAIKASSFASLWCVYAALASVLILLHFEHRCRVQDALPHRPPLFAD